MTTTYPQPTRRRAAQDEANAPLLTRAWTINWEMALYIVIFLVAIFTRFYNLGDRVMSHDESLHTRYSYNLYNAGDFQHTPLMHGPILFHMTALNYFLFGDNDYTARIYTAVLGVLMVMFPLLFRKWLGRWGALLASILLLISPLVMYYNRYIREDTPSIFYTLIMVWCLMMYVDGGRQRRKAVWLYVFSAAMLASLGSKESAFIYIAIFGSFLTLYWIVRLVQHFFRQPGRTLMNFVTMGFLLGGVVALGMYVILSIIRPESLNFLQPPTLELAAFVNWTGLVVLFIIGAVVGSALWAFRGSVARIRLMDIVILLLITTICCGVFIVLEELSWVRANAEETAEALNPNEEVESITATATSNLPIVAAWAVALVVVAVAIVGQMRGWWRVLMRFPEFDVLIIMGTLVLPWITPFVIKLTGASPVDYSRDGIIRAVIALIPMAAISITFGLLWNWKRWLISATIFHVLFAFFFTTMFTNPQGLATGMIGSMGYWLEQQAVRRGNQPQYYYLLIVMPFYEFLPIVGSVLAMFAGLAHFWRSRRETFEARLGVGVEAEEAELARRRPSAFDTGTVAKAAFPFDDAMLTEADRRGAERKAEDANSASTFADEELPPMASLMSTTDEAIERRVRAQRTIRRADRLVTVPFLLMVAWWALLNMIGYTLAGEKMPWLATHMTVPMILLTGWYFGRVLEHLDWATFWRRGWLLLPLFLLLFVALFQVFEPFLVGQSPFAGLEQQQLAGLYEWIALIAVVGIVLLFIWQVAEATGWAHVRRMIGAAVLLGLSVLTFRSAWMFSFINYDLPTEFGVYAHSATSVKTVLDDLEELSRRTTGGLDMRFVYDNETSWPNSWYYRVFPNGQFVGANPTPQALRDAVAVVVGEANRSKVEPILEDRYFRQEYIRMWWPMQDYFNLNAQRVVNTFDFNPENTQAGQIRRGLWDIWWARDYGAYSTAVGGNWTLVSWPVSDRMHFYVRKDIAAQIWDLGAGESEIFAQAAAAETVNVCVDNWQPLSASLVFDVGEGGALSHPIDLEVATDGRVYVADEFNNRIVVFNPDGTYAGNLGTLSLNRPNGVALAADGDVYIADTWNFRVQVANSSGEVVRGWGQPGQFGEVAPTDPTDGFWGPRDIALDATGNVYISDTGNKRVRVYTAQGEYVRDIGGFGADEGLLNEPSGLALHPDGRLFVADTWNRRISVFNAAGGFQYAFPVRGWYDDLGNRPYLALDVARNLLYVTDPEGGRVLVYDASGACVGSFGQAGDTLDLSQMKTAGGIAVDAAGNVYLTDSGTNRVLRFPPFPFTAPIPVEVTAETTGEAVSVEASAEEATDAFSAGGVRVEEDGQIVEDVIAVIATDEATGEVNDADTAASTPEQTP